MPGILDWPTSSVWTGFHVFNLHHTLRSRDEFFQSYLCVQHGLQICQDCKHLAALSISEWPYWEGHTLTIQQVLHCRS